MNQTIDKLNDMKSSNDLGGIGAMTGKSSVIPAPHRLSFS